MEIVQIFVDILAAAFVLEIFTIGLLVANRKKLLPWAMKQYAQAQTQKFLHARGISPRG